MNRRRFLASALVVTGGLGLVPTIQKGNTMSDSELTIHQNWQSYLPADFSGSLSLEPIKMSRDEWRDKLSSAAFDVLRKDGTERPGSSPLDNQHDRGVFACAGCGLPLFTSSMKFDSGTGWPSFFTHIPGHLTTKKDFKLIWPRTEYHCTRCAGHQGHVFDDGPQPTKERWCNNGVALSFIPSDSA